MIARLLCLDPGLASCGIAVIEEHRDPPGYLRCTFLDVVRTKPSPKKLHRLADDDTTDRLAEVLDTFAAALRDHEPHVVCFERFSPPRNASAAAKIAMVVGGIVALTNASGLPMLRPSPQEVKKAVTGSKSASKGDVAGAVQARVDTDLAGMLEARHIPRGAWEHAYDAVAVGLACLGSDVVKALVGRAAA